MNLKILTAFLGLTTLALGFTTSFFYLLNKASEKTIADRELTITSYKKVINAVSRSSSISSEKLKAVLSADFNFGEYGYNNDHNEFYYVLHPKTKEVNQNEHWNFMGLQLVFDHQKKLKTVELYKP